MNSSTAAPAPSTGAALEARNASEGTPTPAKAAPAPALCACYSGPVTPVTLNTARTPATASLVSAGEASSRV